MLDLFTFFAQIEDSFAAKSRYVCQTEIRDKKIQSVKCKTIEIEADDDKKPAQQKAGDKEHVHGDDSSSEEDDDVDFNDKDDEEISSKLISIKQELKLQTTGAVNVDGSSLINIFEMYVCFFLLIRCSEKSCTTNITICSNSVIR